MSSDNAADETVNLLQRWHAGEQSALGKLLEETEPWLRSAIRPSLNAQIRRVEDSADFAQSAVVRFLVTGPRFLPASRGQFRALMKRIAMNEIIDRQRRLRVVDRDVDSAPKSQYGESVLDLRADQSAAQPSRAVARDEERAWVRLAMELLDDRERQLLYAREVDGRDWGDIAKELGYDSSDAARMACNRLLPSVAKLVLKLHQGRLKELLPDDERV